MGSVRFIGLLSGGSAGRLGHTDKVELIARAVYLDNRLFVRAAKYCDDLYESWYILSVMHGVINPSQQIPAYDRDLRYISATERRLWRVRIEQELQAKGLLDDDVVIWWHATLPYSDLLTGLWPVNKQNYPLKSMGLGEQMAWYAARGY